MAERGSKCLVCGGFHLVGASVQLAVIGNRPSSLLTIRTVCRESSEPGDGQKYLEVRHTTNGARL